MHARKHQEVKALAECEVPGTTHCGPGASGETKVCRHGIAQSGARWNWLTFNNLIAARP